MRRVGAFGAGRRINVLAPGDGGQPTEKPIVDVVFEVVDKGRSDIVAMRGEGVHRRFAGGDGESVDERCCSFFAVLASGGIVENRDGEIEVFGDMADGELLEDRVGDGPAVLGGDCVSDQEKDPSPPTANPVKRSLVLQTSSDEKQRGADLIVETDVVNQRLWDIVQSEIVFQIPNTIG